jgi:DNA-directed RNA polymerase subunit RPC12/RpoP
MEEKQEYICGECGKDVKLEDRICPHCGTEISEVEEDYVCGNCGGELSEDDTMCPFCGEDVSQVVDESLKEFRKRISIFSLKPTKSKDGGEIMTTFGWFYLIWGSVLLILSVILYATADKSNVYASYPSLLGTEWSVLIVTSGAILLILGMYAKRGIAFYLYIGLLVLFANFVLFIVNFVNKPIIIPFVMSSAVFGLIIWLLIKSTPAYRNWYRKRIRRE